MFDKKPHYALVFSGGGAKGAYEIGAWKALRELNIKINAVCGASVGALNAAFVAQDDFELALRVWSNLTIDQVVDVPAKMLKNGKLKFSLKSLSRIGEFNLDFKNLGLNPRPLQDLLKAEVREDLIRRSEIDLGIVTVKAGILKPCEIYLDDMPYGTLPDYLLASASFPAFRRAEINGKHFIDGALHDNIPHAMMKSRGYRKIIVIDVSGFGVNKRPDVTGTETIYIKTSIPLGNVLDFNPAKATVAMNAGYLDTMKVYEKNDGLNYFILRDHGIEDDYMRRLLNPEYIAGYSRFLKLNGRKCIPENAAALVREIMPAGQRSNRNLILCLVESAAAALDIDRNRLYKLSDLIEKIQNKYADIMQSGTVPSKKESESFFKMIEHTISLFVSERELSDYSPYEYAKIMRSSRAVENLFPELASAEILLSLINR